MGHLPCAQGSCTESKEVVFKTDMLRSAWCLILFCIVATENRIWLNDGLFQSRSMSYFAKWVIKQLKYSNVGGMYGRLWLKAFTLLLWVCFPNKQCINVLDKKWWYTSTLGMFLLPWPRSDIVWQKPNMNYFWQLFTTSLPW